MFQSDQNGRAMSWRPGWPGDVEIGQIGW
jgi:hypothetical protein